MDGDITKSKRDNGIKETPSKFSGTQFVLPAGPSQKILWSKAQALERLGGDEELLQELCEIFLDESPKLLQALRQAIVDTDSEAVMRAAHSLKGELGYLGAPGALQAARELEEMGHEGKLSRAAEVLLVLEREMASVHLALKDPAGSAVNNLPPRPGPEPASTATALQCDTVLIAEDDPIFCRILETWLKKWNYRVTSLANGLDAWSVLQQKDSPQMAILDWMMPGL